MSDRYRSLLFAAADDEDALAAALASEADAIVADLEDAVPAGRKAEARDVVAVAFAGARGTAARLVRVNAAGSDHFADDLALVRSLDLDAIVVPRATPGAVAELGSDGPPLIAVVETANGLRAAYQTASLPRVAGVALGAKDLGLDLGLRPTPDAQELLYARSKLVVDAVAAGAELIFDRVHPGGPGVEVDARFARTLGFRGKSTLQPGDARVINEVFGER